jgi:tetratricopeptide (TPR) repeat protein
MGRYKKAEKVYVEALEIRRKTLGKHHADYASSLNALARIYDKIDKKDEALKLY